MEQLLTQFNFSPGEIIVYKTLLKLGGAKVSEVARASRLKRTSCQEYVQSLEKKGFLNSSKIGNKHVYQTEDPDKFRQIINERQYIVDALIPKLRQRPEREEWQVKEVELQAAQQHLRRAKRKKQIVALFGDEVVGGTLLVSNIVILVSEDKELPALEITSKSIFKLHQALLKSEK